MPRFGLCGPTYSSKSLSVDAQRTVNWYPEIAENPHAKAPLPMYPTPGIRKFAFETRTFTAALESSSAVDDASTGSVAWTNPANAETLDAVYATVTVTALFSSNSSHYLLLDGYTLGLPAGATIFGISAQVTGHYTTVGGGGAIGIFPVKNGVIQTTGSKFDGFGSYAGTDRTITYGDATDLWETSWSDSDTIGLAFKVFGPSVVGTHSTFYVDSITLIVYYGTALGGNSSRGLHAINDRAFAVVGPNFYELASDGIVTLRGTVADDDLPVSIAGGASCVLIVSAGQAYSYNLTTDVLAPVTGMLGTPSQAGYADGYFIVTLQDTQRFQISALNDATSWDALDIAQISVFPDNIVSMLVDHRELWLWGKKSSQVYFDSGNADFPWEPIPGAFIEQGCAAKDSPVRLDNSVFWLGEDERGAAVAWRASGYAPARVSNHAVEQTWQSYSTVTDAIGYSYQADGHAFWVLSFPSAKATWVYDAATNMWHERGTWDAARGVYLAHRSQCHIYAFGKHLVADRLAPNIYEMSTAFNDEDGEPIRRMRRAPHISNEQQWLFYSQLQVDLEVGLGLPFGQGSNPQIMLRWSDDSAKTWSNEHWQSAGEIGTYKTRAVWRRMGRSRDRIYEVVVTDPVPWRIVDAYLQVMA